MTIFLNALLNLFIGMSYYLMLGFTLVGIFSIFVKKEWLAAHLSGNDIWASVKACLFGVPLPLCSCAVIPTGMYLKDNGASDATTTAFLISTPQTGVDSIVATYGMLGITFAWYRPIVAFISGVLGGFFVSLFTKKDRAQKEADDVKMQPECTDGNCGITDNNANIPFGQKIKKAIHYSYVESISEITLHFIIGLIISALITVLIPADLLVTWGLNSGIMAMLIMIAVGLPMYICSTASIPIAITLMIKGISPGAAFVFLFMGPFTNVLSIGILSKKLGKKVVAIYVVVAMVCAVGFGLLLDLLIDKFSLPISIARDMIDGESYTLFNKIIAGIFLGLTIYGLVLRAIGKVRKMRAKKKTTTDARVFNVNGMTCNHCTGTVEARLLKEKKVTNVAADFENNTIKVWGDLNADVIGKIINDLGYEFAGEIINTQDDTVTYTLNGMSCNHCTGSVESKLLAMKNVDNVKASFENNTVIVTGSITKDEVRRIITDLGYEMD